MKFIQTQRKYTEEAHQPSELMLCNVDSISRITIEQNIVRCNFGNIESDYFCIVAYDDKGAKFDIMVCKDYNEAKEKLDDIIWQFSCASEE